MTYLLTGPPSPNYLRLLLSSRGTLCNHNPLYRRHQSNSGRLTICRTQATGASWLCHMHHPCHRLLAELGDRTRKHVNGPTSHAVVTLVRAAGRTDGRGGVGGGGECAVGAGAGGAGAGATCGGAGVVGLRLLAQETGRFPRGKRPVWLCSGLRVIRGGRSGP